MWVLRLQQLRTTGIDYLFFLLLVFNLNTNDMISMCLVLLNLCSSFSSLRFVRLEHLFSAILPLVPAQFEDFVQKQCRMARDELVQQ